jgi:hypothetical protein
MLASPAYRVLSQSAHRVLARLELELAHHGGSDNGKLPVTFDDFVAYGIDRHSIAPAIREVVALGFVEITERGRAGNAEWRQPNKFRLTYRFVRGEDQTDEWRRFKSVEEARAVAQAARQERQHPVRKIPPAGAETPHRKAHTPRWAKPTPQCWCTIPHYSRCLGWGVYFSHAQNSTEAERTCHIDRRG